MKLSIGFCGDAMVEGGRPGAISKHELSGVLR